MKTSVIKHTLAAALFIAGMNMVTSCNSCSRKDDGVTTTETKIDTVYIDTCMAGHDTIAGYEGNASGRSIPVGRHKATASRPAKGKTISGKGTATGSKKTELTEDEITDRVENSSSHAYTKNGKPVNPGGTSGEGQGTGTGSTGNNSRVTTKADQNRN